MYLAVDVIIIKLASIAVVEDGTLLPTVLLSLDLDDLRVPPAGEKSAGLLLGPPEFPFGS